MKRELADRLRAAAPIAALMGQAFGRPNIDWSERKSAAFPAAILTTASPGRTYEQAGTDGLVRPRIRIEVQANTPLQAEAVRDAIVVEMERDALVGDVQFNRSQLAFERDMDPEDLAGGIKVFRTILDFFVPYSQN